MKIVENRLYYFIFSACVIGLGILFMVVNGVSGRGVFNFDVEFSGGTSFTIDIGQPFENNDIETVVRDITGQSSPQVQKILNTNQVMIKMRSITVDERMSLIEAFSEKYGIDRDAFTYSDVSPSVSADMQRAAILAITVACVLMLIYVSFRLDIRMGGSAILTQLHDVLIMLTVYAVLRIPLNYSFIAAILTILGYSINNTIVIFDRVRENKKLATKLPPAELMNLSVKQTLRRSLFTSITTLLSIISLYIIGVSSIKDFALPIIIGILFGSYSSVFLAGSFWFVMNDKRKIKQA